jgi:hypothetical protein
MQPGAQLMALGVEAMVGAKLAARWQENMPLSVIRLGLNVTVERGSTQRQTQLEKVAAFKELYLFYWQHVQLAITLGQLEVLNKAMEKMLNGMGIEEYAGALIQPPEPQALPAPVPSPDVAMPGIVAGQGQALPPAEQSIEEPVVEEPAYAAV